MVLCATSLMETDPRAEQMVAQIRNFFSHKIFLNHYLLAAAGLNSETTSVVLRAVRCIQVEFRELKRVLFWFDFLFGFCCCCFGLWWFFCVFWSFFFFFLQCCSPFISPN